MNKHLAAGFSILSIVSVVGCFAAPSADDSVRASAADLSQNGGISDMVYLGSSAFLRRCAGNTLGCGTAVSSVADATPYFSAPRAWSRSTCNQYFTFRVNGRCAEARRMEISDTHNFIEGNPGLFDALGLSHSDGSGCSGSGHASDVQITPGRHCSNDTTSGSDDDTSTGTSTSTSSSSGGSTTTTTGKPGSTGKSGTDTSSGGTDDNTSTNDKNGSTDDGSSGSSGKDPTSGK